MEQIGENLGSQSVLLRNGHLCLKKKNLLKHGFTHFWGCFDGLCGFGGTKINALNQCWIQEDIGIVEK